MTVWTGWKGPGWAMMRLAGVAAMAAAVATTHAQSDCAAHATVNAFRSGVGEHCFPRCGTRARTPALAQCADY